MNEFAIVSEKFGDTDTDLESIVKEFSNTLQSVAKNYGEKVSRKKRNY